MNAKKSIIFYDMVYVVERNGAINKMLQPKVDDFDFWFIFLWRSQYL
jgi:hypothetical protein